MSRVKSIVLAIALTAASVGALAALAEGSDPVNPGPVNPQVAPAIPPGLLTPVRYSTVELSRPVTPVRKAPADLVKDIVARYGGLSILEARFGQPPPGWGEGSDSSQVVPEEYRSGKWLYLTVAADNPAAGSMRPIWEAHLVAGALRDELHATDAANGDLIAARVSLRLPSGRVVENVGSGLGNVAFNQGFSPANSASIERQVRAATHALGLEVRSLAVLHPLQAAPAVVVTTTDPAKFVAQADTIVGEIFGRKAMYEGQYFQADDPTGGPVFIQSVAYRAGVGGRWVRPDLDTRARPLASGR
jgi:hypothetical protein